MKILHLIPSFGPGGAERQLSLLAPALSQAGMECHVVYGSEGVNFDAITESTLAHQLPIRAATDPRRLADIARLLRKVKPDVVQTWLTQMDVTGGLVAQTLGLPHILSERSSSMAYPPSWKNRLRTRIGQRASMVIANSQGGVSYWREQGARGPILHIPNAFIPSRPGTPTDAGALPQSNLIMFAGRFSYEKNLENLIEGLDIALGARPAYRVILFGEGPLEEQLKERIARSMHVNRYWTPGFSNHLSYWFERADVFVSASHFEGHPNTVIESAACRCPLVLSNIGAHRDILPPDAATYVDGASATSIAQGILAAIDCPEEARRKAANAANIVAELTIERQVQIYQQAYLVAKGKAAIESLQNLKGGALRETD